MKLKKLLAASALCLTALTAAACGGGTAEKAPEAWKPQQDVKVIVAYKPGSGMDTTARLLAHDAERFVGKTLIVENIPGEDGRKGWTELSKAKPDGYTLGVINLPTFTTMAIEKDAPFTEKDIVPICNHLMETSVVAVRKSSHFNTLKELVDYAKAHPGELKASTNGDHNSNHTAVQLLAKSAGFTYIPVNCDGTAEQLKELSNGEVDFACATAGDLEPLVRGGNAPLKVLGVFSEKRLDSMKDIPTLGELGYYNKWYGSARALVAPKGTPQNIIKFYEDAFKLTMTDEQTIRDHKNAGLEPHYLNSQELGKLIQDQLDFSKNVITKLYE